MAEEHHPTGDLQSIGQALQFGLQRTVTDDEKHDIGIARRQVRGHLQERDSCRFSGLSLPTTPMHLLDVGQPSSRRA